MGFHSDLARTNTPEAWEVYKKAMSACLDRDVKLRFATLAADKAGIDFYATYGKGHVVRKSVQVKVCWGPLGYLFYPYETRSQSGRLGWVFSHEPADLILWIRAAEDLSTWNARLYAMPPVIEWFYANKQTVLEKSKWNRQGTAALYNLWNVDTVMWLKGECFYP
jgi:hypothetical protein